MQIAGKSSYKYICGVCASDEIIPFHEQKSVPTNSCILLQSKEEALNYPEGEISLGYCTHCSFISNLAFDPALTEYSQRYEETQGFSNTFNTFQKELGYKLVKRYQLFNKHILEIGCGKGEFISLICEIGNNHGTGFDPAYVEERNPNKPLNKVNFIKDFYSGKYAHIKADFIICKMTLEHIPNPYEFAYMIRQSIADQLESVVFFQVPDVTRIIREGAFEDIYYEHCSYFCPNSISYLFQKSSFEVINCTTAYMDQYVMIEAKPSADNSSHSNLYKCKLDEIAHWIKNFKDRYEQKLKAWRKEIENTIKNYQKIVLWGSGSKAVSFLTSLGITNEVEYVVDINPHKHGYFIAGTGQKIIGPDDLSKYKPDKIIIMNPIYYNEILSELSRQNLNAELIPINIFEK
jgi:hypothetical protein